MAAGGEGTVTFRVWPTHAGAVDSAGREPIFDPDYKRGQIFWETVDDQLLGHAVINVPKGEWCHVIYCNDPFTPGFVAAENFAHPLRLAQAGTITLDRITESSFWPQLVHNGQRR